MRATNYLILVLFGNLISAQHFTQEWDSLLHLREKGNYLELIQYGNQLLQKTQNESELAEIHYFIASGYQTTNYQLGLVHLDSSKTFSHPSKRFNLEQDALHILLHRKGGNSEQVLLKGREFLNKIPVDSFPELQFKVLRNMSISYRKLNYYDSAMQYVLAADQIAETLQDNKLKYYARLSKANVLYALKQYEKCLQIELDLLRITREMQNENLILTSLINLGASYSKLEKLDSTLYYYTLAAEKAKDLDLYQAALLTNNMGIMNEKRGNYEMAKATFLESIDYASQISRPDIAVRSYFSLAELIYEVFKDLNLAESYTRQGLELATDIKSLEDQYSLYELLYRIESKRKNFNKAIHYLEIAGDLQDSILNAEKVKIIEELETKYETERKNNEIQNLQQATAIKDLEIRQKNLFLLIGFLLVLTGGVFIAFIWRQRQLKIHQKTDELNQRLLRSQLNPHFLFNALNAIQQKVLSNKNNQEAADYLAKFSQMTRQILETNSEDLILLEDELELIKQYIDLQKLRCNHPIIVSIEISGDLETEWIKIPPMLTQPIIENAFEHGLLPKNAPGQLIIEISQKEGYLTLKVKDDGAGINPNIQRDHHSMGSRITTDRLKLLEKKFKKKTFFEISTIQQELSKFTVVTLTIPVL